MEAVKDLLAILWRSLNDGLEDPLDLPHALLDVLFNGGSIVTDITLTSIWGWGNHGLDLVLVYLEEDL